jgi:hypothetical protein
MAGANSAGRYMIVARKIKGMSSSAFLESLRRAGIITGKGALKAKYKKGSSQKTADKTR